MPGDGSQRGKSGGDFSRLIALSVAACQQECCPLGTRDPFRSLAQLVRPLDTPYILPKCFISLATRCYARWIFRLLIKDCGQNTIDHLRSFPGVVCRWRDDRRAICVLLKPMVTRWAPFSTAFITDDAARGCVSARLPSIS